jgi:polysaccharide pyruvyl transferase WcaK-like protein
MGSRIFVYGYNGVRNIGADCRIMPILAHLRRLAPDAEIVVNTFGRHELDFVADVEVDYFHPATYAVAAKRRIRDADVAILCEGNMLTDGFTPHMVKAFTLAMEQGEALGVPTVGLALDSGSLSPRLEPRVMSALSTMELVTARSAGAGRSLKERGVTSRVEVTADSAVNMVLPDEAHRQRVLRGLGMAGGPVHGLAPVDFSMFPARIAPFGRRDDYVRWPFKGTWPDGGRERSARLLGQWTEYAHHLLATDLDARVAVFALDPSDRNFATALHARIDRPDRTVLVLGRDHGPLDVSAALSGLRSMTTSRYHGLVLTLPYSIPVIALGHDTRMSFITEELGVPEYFVDHTTPTLIGDLTERHSHLMTHADDVRTRLEAGFRSMRSRDLENYTHVGGVLEELDFRVEYDHLHGRIPSHR